MREGEAEKRVKMSQKPEKECLRRKTGELERGVSKVVSYRVRRVIKRRERVSQRRKTVTDGE